MYASFMVRVWREEAGEGMPASDVWRGEIESVQSGEVWHFEGLEVLTALLTNVVESGAPPPATPTDSPNE